MRLRVAVLVVGLGCAGAGGDDGGGEGNAGGVTIPVTGPLVVGFFPPITGSLLADDPAEIQSDQGMGDDVAHLQFALAEVKRCLGALPVTVRLAATRRIELEDEGKVTTLLIPPDAARDIGAVLVRPGAEPLVVDGREGRATLNLRLAEAAAAYFDAPACRTIRLE